MKKAKTITRERPFQYLRRKDSNEPFSEEVVRNWYIARAYVLDKLKDISFGPDSEESLHVVVGGDTPLMLSVLRQLALSAHFVNYEEQDQSGRLSCRNRTVITLVSKKDAAEIVGELEKEEYLCNLLNYCRHSIFGDVRNADSMIDIELEIVRDQCEDSKMLLITEDGVKAFMDSQNPDLVFSVDPRKAIYARRAYGLGAVIDNIPYENINSAGRYNRALAAFQYKVLKDTGEWKLVEESKWVEDLNVVKNGLSNLFCADCFESREKAIKQLYPRNKKYSENDVMAVWEKYNDALSRSEHCRWIVEKLILGYRPMDQHERTEYASLFGNSRTAYSKRLKNRFSDPVHIDMCSYRTLRRVDPDNMKYDSFLMLAIPLILEKIRKDEGKGTTAARTGKQKSVPDSDRGR